MKNRFAVFEIFYNFELSFDTKLSPAFSFCPRTRIRNQSLKVDNVHPHFQNIMTASLSEEFNVLSCVLFENPGLAIE